MSQRPNNYKYNKKELVAEQSGLFWSFFGLTAAFILGIVTQAVFSPERVKSQVQQATGRIHADLEVSFEQAHLSLAEGFWPEIAVVINNVHLVSTKNCWLGPDLLANEIKLPLSFFSLIRGKVAIDTVKVDEVQLRLRSPYKPCLPESSATSGNVSKEVATGNASEAPSQATVNSVANSKLNSPGPSDFETEGPKNPIENVLIRTLRVTYEPTGVGAIRFDKLRFRREQDSKNLRVDGLINLGAETLAADFSSFASFNLDYLAGKDPTLKGAIKGNWREGLYDFQIDYVSSTENLIVLGDLRHIPVSQILPALKKYRLINNTLDGKSLWLSQKISFQGSLQSPETQVLRIEHLGIEGDLGEIKSSRIEFASLSPIRLKPFELDLRGIGVEKLLKAFNKTHPGPTFGSLGVFSGKLKYYDDQQLELKGDHSGLEFIFSSRGHRETQVISLISGDLSYKKDQWGIDLHQIRPLEGYFEGDIKLAADREWRQVKLDVDLKELQLSPKVISLMTEGGSISPLSGDFKLSLDQGKLQQLYGKLKSKSFVYDRLEANGFQMGLTTVAGNVVAKTQIQSVKIPKDWERLSFVSPMQLWAKDQVEDLKMSDFSTLFTLSEKNAFSWNDLRFKSNSWKFQSDGGWSEAGAVNGAFYLSGPRNRQAWKLTGRREKYDWVKP